MIKIKEQALVEQLIEQLFVERFKKAVLRQLAWLDVVPCNVVILGLAEDRHRRELGPAITDDHRWAVAPPDRPSSPGSGSVP